MPLIYLTDYGVGNLHSVKNALENCGASVETVTDMSKLADAECVVFPGVGAFDSTMERIAPYREEILKHLESGVPALGICIGAQILFDSSEEGKEKGLGLFKGQVIGLEAERLPHMGWNTVESDDPLLNGTPDRDFYFAHSYRGRPEDQTTITGTTEYENWHIPVIFRRFNTYGVQFHPEKSSISGMKVLKNFIKFGEECQ
ncbi:MAG: imidazole glycerol phosphate synthase subunit HisH [Candidatus Methanomethylophilaceae archaeon]|nr:imidazole glycerol-phosphate synthase subunit HisH [Candidatus Methanomethylophilaceae archaeon]